MPYQTTVLLTACLFLLLCSSYGKLCLADQSNQAADPSMTPDVYCDEDGCREFSRWQLGIGGGAGRRTNPLINSDDINIYWFVDIAYFGNHFFFDNGDLGLTLYANDNMSLNAIVTYGNEKTFFSHINDESFSLSGIVDLVAAEDEVTIPPANPGNSPEPPTADSETSSTTDTEDPPDRDLSIESGIEIIYTLPHGELHSQLLTDISSTHNGQELWFSYSLPYRWENIKLVPSLGFSWKSQQLVDYYYGIRADETTEARSRYEADSSTTNLFFKLSLAYRLSSHWQLVSVLEYQTLGDEIKASPIVDDNHLSTYFIGLLYRF